MDGALAIIALFFVIGIVFGAVIVIAVTILRRDVGPPDDPDDPPSYGPPGPGGPSPDLDLDGWQDEGPGGTEDNPRWQSYGR
jgi:hypothetical protein